MKKQSIVRKILSGSPIKKYTQPGLIIDTSGAGSAFSGAADAVNEKVAKLSKKKNTQDTEEEEDDQEEEDQDNYIPPYTDPADKMEGYDLSKTYVDPTTGLKITK